MSLAGPFPNPFPSLADDEVHVWKCGLHTSETDIDNRFALLSEEEQERATRFKVERPRHQFVIARSTLRTLIGFYLDLPPREVRFQTSGHGKPHLLNPPANLEFNLSHSHDLALLAFSRRSPIGIDVEWVDRKISHAEIAERFFSELERKHLLGLPVEERQRAFVECWTRKEAYLKARGFGLSRDLRTFSVSLSSDPNPRLLEDREEPSAVHKWRIYPLRPEHGYCGAIAVSADSAEMKVICRW